MSKNFLDLSGLTQYDGLLKQYIDENAEKVKYNTTAYWDAQITTPSEEGVIYIYSDYQTDSEGNDIPGIKVGDGNAYIPDLQFIDYKYSQHLADTVSHITAAERTAWNNKVRVIVDSQDSEKLVFTTN